MLLWVAQAGTPIAGAPSGDVYLVHTLVVGLGEFGDEGGEEVGGGGSESGRQTSV